MAIPVRALDVGHKHDLKIEKLKKGTKDTGDDDKKISTSF
jgi:hypothetical protein